MQRESLSFPVLTGAFVVLTLVLASLPVDWPHGDFIEYWAAGRLNAAGRDPYDPATLLVQQQEAGLTEPAPVVMYNPPWTLALAMPLGAMDFALARSVWLALQIVTILWCASRLWLLVGGEPRHTIRACCVALLWWPALSALHMGQVSTVILAGLVGFLVSVSRRSEMAAGSCLAATLLKPQLLAPVWVVVLLWVVEGRRWKVPIGTAAALTLASIIAFAPNPRVFAQYQHLMTAAPPPFESPAVSSMVRVFARTAGSWPQYLLTVAGAFVVALAWRRRRETWDFGRELPWLVTASLLVTAYGGWSFDLVLLLIPIFAAAAALARDGDRAMLLAGALIFGAASATMAAMFFNGVPEQLYIWVTPVVALACRFLRRDATARQWVGASAHRP